MTTETTLTPFVPWSDDKIPLTLSADDLAKVRALPPLPIPEPEDYDAPDVIVTDTLTGQRYMVTRFPCGGGCGCALYADEWDGD
ncbi:hypothetical protein SAMN05661080_05159 [Modestobacter sp. DSM 44400]|uniref:hypothetical protein n=1 Tax=Modestobacter sp. DSM 44400 TaxID=1550230 RepID=UPI000897037C|nr:hypothetical protein [Modestobacter sp. DSM 44400]SDY96760.1 hypothetical protein SAMN05661080_05159 [Modestobacter sp. DSM 44400]